MALINHRAREIHFKLVYYGPGLGGKTTNLRLLHERLPAERRGRLLSIATDHERTLFFDFLPIDLGLVNGFQTRFHLYTVPGQVYYRLSRRAVLQGVDGLVFVADSHPAREQSNRESLRDLEDHLATLGHAPAELARMPRVFQYNKRDVPGALPVERLRAALNPGGAPEFEAVACEGRGVSDTLRSICKLVLARLAGQVSSGAMAGPPVAASPASATAAAPESSAAGPKPAAAPRPGAATRFRRAPGATSELRPATGNGVTGSTGAPAPDAPTQARPPVPLPVRS